jgi:predicted DNA-binding transcriptional regulator YafY
MAARSSFKPPSQACGNHALGVSWGSKAKVLGPPELKKRVRDEVMKMLSFTATTNHGL